MEAGLSLGEIGMLIGLYYAPGIFLAFPSGMLGERFSDKRVIVLSLLAMTLGATVAALSPDVTGLMVGRLLSWVGELSALAGPSGSGGCSAVGVWLLIGLPVAVILVLPAVALRPESRAIGMGIFQTWLYFGTTFMPPIAGWMQ